MAEEQSGVELQTGLGKLKMSGQNVGVFIGLLTLLIVSVTAYAFYGHKEDALMGTAALVKALEKTADVQERMVKAQREQNCLMRIKPDVRDRDTICEQLAR
jgi:hypothetical protein